MVCSLCHQIVKSRTSSCFCLSCRKKTVGGKSKHSSGYVLVYVPFHPHAQPGGSVFEHRILMEQKLGRYLEKNEVIHHINGIKDDNRIENLVITETKEHCKIHNLGKVEERTTPKFFVCLNCHKEYFNKHSKKQPKFCSLGCIAQYKKWKK